MKDPTVQGRGKLFRVLQRVALVATILPGVLLTADFLWVSSGSNEWHTVSDQNGIRIASLKTPGYSLLKYKIDMHVPQSLSSVVFYMTDLQTGADVGASDLSRIETVSAAPVHYVYDTYKLDLPAPFHRLEVMIVNEYHQDPVTKQVRLEVYAAPNKKPLDNHVTRITHLANTWTFTPVESGGVDLESTCEMDLGIPYVVANLVMPRLLADEFDKMRTMLRKDRYRNGKPAFISELHQPIVAEANQRF